MDFAKLILFCENIKRIKRNLERQENVLISMVIEFIKVFFNLLGKDLLMVVEEYRLYSKVLGAFNSTFLAMIPKKYVPKYFEYFRPISLCNGVCNIISKIIARILKPMLSLVILGKQFFFLDSRKIHEAIGIG